MGASHKDRVQCIVNGFREYLEKTSRFYSSKITDVMLHEGAEQAILRLDEHEAKVAAYEKAEKKNG